MHTSGHPVLSNLQPQDASALSLDLLLSNLPGVVYRCLNDPSWTMIFLSAGVEQLTGYPPSAFTGDHAMSYASLIHPDDRAQVADDTNAAVRERRPFQLNYRITTATGKLRWVWEQGVGRVRRGRQCRGARRLHCRHHRAAPRRPAGAGAGRAAGQGARRDLRDRHGLAHHLLEQGRRAALWLGRAGGAGAAHVRPAVRRPRRLQRGLQDVAERRRMGGRAAPAPARRQHPACRHALDPGAGRPELRHAAKNPGDQHRHQRTQEQRGAHPPARLFRRADRTAEPRQPARPPAARPARAVRARTRSGP